ncbi:hypothetical protein AN414_15075 [Serratia marcescens]|nr:hypothetical protein AN414_15075 [Serratia marcescens]
MPAPFFSQRIMVEESLVTKRPCGEMRVVMPSGDISSNSLSGRTLYSSQEKLTMSLGFCGVPCWLR